MELIYTDENRLPLGQLSSFDIDFDATGEKNFELTIVDALLSKGEWVFIPDTEIGGIIDSVIVNTADGAIKYRGRNFRGILNDRIISVPNGQDYVSAQGDISDEINELLTDAGLTQFICLPAAVEDSVSTSVDFAYAPFCTLYDGIIGLANSINFKLVFSYNSSENRVEITPMLQEDFTDFLTYTKDNSINFDLEDSVAVKNHLILVGYSDNQRYQIDLFINDNAQVMSYATTESPIKDSDYILDNRNQQFFGIDEKTKVEVTVSISPIENYELLTTKPSDWNSNYGQYFLQTVTEEDDGISISYDEVQPVEAYRRLSSEPSDWNNNYKVYFFKDGDSYNGVDGVSTVTATYKKVKKKPKDWKNNYGDYYYHETDGLSYFYTAVPGKNRNYYRKQKYKPTDWDTNCNSYYKVVKKNGKTTYETVKVDKKGNSPKWKKYKYYTRVTVTYAPKFSAKTVYAKVETTSPETAPSFVANQFYQKYERAPYFTSCYRKVLDHYGGMISRALENLELYPSNKQNISLTEFDAQIGDIVGGYEEKTGIEMSAPVTNIIYRIERGIQHSVEYVIGD